MTKEIKMVDLYGQYEKIKNDIDNGIQEVINNTSFINGAAVKEFSKELAQYSGANDVVACGNGTDAIQIALMALDLKKGDEVIVPVHTYVASVEAILLLQLTAVYAEVDPDTFNLDPQTIEDLITPNTKAIIPVHLYGQCADMEPIMEIAKKHNLYVIEDTAQAIGAEYTFSNGEIKKAGTIGDIGTTSFFPSKNLGCYGDGGAIFINDKDLAKKCRMVANHGQSEKYKHDIIGCNSRLDSIQASILRVKLKHLDEYSRSRNIVAEKYDMAFSDNEFLTIPKRQYNSTHVFHQYTLKINKVNRDKLKEKLKTYGIPSMIYYPIPLHFQEAYLQEENGPGTFPITEKLSTCVLSLPIHTEMKPDVQNYIIEKVLQSLKELTN